MCCIEKVCQAGRGFQRVEFDYFKRESREIRLAAPVNKKHYIIATWLTTCFIITYDKAIWAPWWTTTKNYLKWNAMQSERYSGSP